MVNAETVIVALTVATTAAIIALIVRDYRQHVRRLDAIEKAGEQRAELIRAQEGPWCRLQVLQVPFALHVGAIEQGRDPELLYPREVIVRLKAQRSAARL
jgi:hypothetical protein